MIGRTDTLIKEVKEVLEWDILKFWSGMQDPRGGFYGKIAEGLAADKDADREEQLNARIIWAFSNAYRMFRKKEYLMPAMNGKDYFIQHFIDHKYGGAFAYVDSWGEKKDTDALLSNQALAIYALSEFYGATKDEESLKQAINLYKIVEKEFHDLTLGGYREVLSRDFTVKDESRLAVSHLYLLESYSNLYRVWRDASLRGVIADLLDVMVSEFFNSATGHIEPRFSKDWNPVPSGCMYGLDLEASWAILDAAYAIEDIDAINHVKDVCLELYKAGMDGLMGEGYVAFGKDVDGAVDSQMVPWVQAESLIANLCAWKYQSVPEGADYALRIWDYIKDHLNDTTDTIAFRMFPMHDARACVQVMNIFR
ncbi:MAG: AGE family epimerase/isomerase [Bacteroidales bacterium]|nr:AGE family epimerase/isomerase [Bacteroidales bacterium]